MRCCMRPLTALTSSALVPFRAAVRSGASAVMVSNASVPGLTRSPSSLSPRVIGDLLERQLDFHGLVVTARGAAVADDRLPVARLRAAALHVALEAHDNLCD